MEADQLVRRRGPQRRTRQTTRRCPIRRIMTAGENVSRSAVVAGSQRRQGFELSLFQDDVGRGGVGGDLVSSCTAARSIRLYFTCTPTGAAARRRSSAIHNACVTCQAGWLEGAGFAHPRGQRQGDADTRRSKRHTWKLVLIV